MVVRTTFLLLSFSFFLASFAFIKLDALNEKIEQLKKEKKLMAFHPENKKAKNDKYSNKEIIVLGKRLFRDSIMSRNNNVSCASCHIDTKGFSNGETFGIGTNGNKTKRHVPHLYNLEINTTYFWDGRATSMEEQLTKVITSKDELDMSYSELISRLNKNESYKSTFDSLFPGTGISKSTIMQSIIAYEKSITASDAPFDKFLEGDTNALTPIQKKGFELFITKANCIACHNGANLTDGTFHNVGVRTDDLGRSLIDKIGMNNEFNATPYPFFSTFKAFKTPSLRNVKLSAPYFHDGSKKTLREIVEFYNKGGENPDQTGLAKEIHPLNLEEEEIEALVEFLGTFTSVQY